jgi:hypothetical protein
VQLRALPARRERAPAALRVDLALFRAIAVVAVVAGAALGFGGGGLLALLAVLSRQQVRNK